MNIWKVRTAEREEFVKPQSWLTALWRTHHRIIYFEINSISLHVDLQKDGIQKKKQWPDLSLSNGTGRYNLMAPGNFQVGYLPLWSERITGTYSLTLTQCGSVKWSWQAYTPGLHDSSARVWNSLFIVWLSRVCLWAIALFYKIRGAVFCRFRSVMVVVLLNASFSWEFALGLALMVGIVWQKARFVGLSLVSVEGLVSCLWSSPLRGLC